MIYGTCSCKATCEDPNGKSGCNRDCLGTEGCTCPAGFFMQRSDCISERECGCFVAEANLVIPNGETSVNDDCTQKCSCNNNQLICEDYRCSTNALCDVKNEVRQCYCNEGYEGDGETCESLYTDCQDVYDAGHRQDGVYTIMPTGWPSSPFNVTCKMENGGGWTVFQRRTDGSTSFYQNWTAYKDGFGDSRNFWLGNEKLHYLTNQRIYKLRFDITTSNGNDEYADYAEYTKFQIESESNNYTMNQLGLRSGTGGTGDYFFRNRRKPFSTHDRDNDACGTFDCAEKHRSGWWHSNIWCSSCESDSFCYYFHYNSSCNTMCTHENLNGVYSGGNGEMIYSSHALYCNVQYVEMKIRPSS
ncbi:microfibril-associated glycoprotein 4-like [Apostichopus japonicus]|uniref:microfibril-associated glycoprotein 4-like n=1 Tax=Stichopus japonicus TaxID=307972 RepID=UPI003AB583FF